VTGFDGTPGGPEATEDGRVSETVEVPVNAITKENVAAFGG
jgi:hypothetical protein